MFSECLWDICVLMLASILFMDVCCSSVGLCQKPFIHFPVNEHLFCWFVASMFFYYSKAAVDILFTVTCCKGQVCVWYLYKSITLGSQGMHIFKCNGQHLILFQCGFLSIHSTTMSICLLHFFLPALGIIKLLNFGVNNGSLLLFDF